MSPQSDMEKSAASLNHGLALYQSVGDNDGMAEALYLLGWTTHQQGDDTRAIALLEESLALSRTIGNSYVMTWALLYLGSLELAQGKLAPAAAYFTEAHTIASDAGNRFDQVHAARLRGIVAYHQGDYVQAQAFLDHSLILAREVERGVRPFILSDLVLVALAQGHIPRAISLLHESLSGMRDRNLPGGVMDTLEALAGALAAKGKAEHAALLGSVCLGNLIYHPRLYRLPSAKSSQCPASNRAIMLVSTDVKPFLRVHSRRNVGLRIR